MTIQLMSYGQKKYFPPSGQKQSLPPSGQKKIFTSLWTKTIFPSLRTTKPNLRDKKIFGPSRGTKKLGFFTEKKKIFKHFWAENNEKMSHWALAGKKQSRQPWIKKSKEKCPPFHSFSPTFSLILEIFSSNTFLSPFLPFSLLGHFFSGFLFFCSVIILR